jgi:hypothetical protein
MANTIPSRRILRRYKIEARQMPDLDPLESVAVSGLDSASPIAALISVLVDTGVLSPRAIYENALHDRSAAADDPTMQL